MDHPDFRLDGKIFATLGYPDEGSAMVKLTPKQQRDFMTTAPGVFIPCKGAWGLRGATSILLASADKRVVRDALEDAYKNLAAKPKRKTIRKLSQA